MFSLTGEWFLPILDIIYVFTALFLSGLWSNKITVNIPPEERSRIKYNF